MAVSSRRPPSLSGLSSGRCVGAPYTDSVAVVAADPLSIEDIELT
jgi:hypothetical protein